MSAETGSGNDEVDLKIVGNGNEIELEEKLLECMAETPGEQNQPRSLEHQFEMVNEICMTSHSCPFIIKNYTCNTSNDLCTRNW